MVRFVLLAGLVVPLLTACEVTTDEPSAVAEPVATEAAEAPKPTEELTPTEEVAGDIDRDEIAETVEGFTKAFMGADILKLATYWSSECSEEDIASVNASAALAAGFAGGEVEFAVNAELLRLDQVGPNRVVVLDDQPPGTYVMLIDGRPLPEDDSPNEDDSLELVFEDDGFWHITNCEGFAAEF